jgi:U3 small nucleolar RNA-associated protein 25
MKSTNEPSEPEAEADARLEAFKQRLLPSLLTAMSTAVGAAQTMLFVPRYFDFVRVRQLLVAEDVPFVAVSEYSTAPQVSRARNALQKREVRRETKPTSPLPNTPYSPLPN